MSHGQRQEREGEGVPPRPGTGNGGGVGQPRRGIARLRHRLYEILELGRGDDRTSQVVDAALVALIVLNVAAFVAETVPQLAATYASEFQAFEHASVAVFTVEYLLRLWVAVEVPFLKRMSPLAARTHYALRPAALIDLAAILPYYLAHLFAIDLRVLRALRLLRFLKLTRYSPAMHVLLRVISNERRSLMGAGLLLSAAILFASTGIHYIEGETQPEKFGSIPAAAWWAVATLTTVGYGDVTPVTALGRLFGACTMIVGLCILALPVAIISTGFAQEVGRRDFVVNWSLMSKIPMLAELDAAEAAVIMPLFHAHNLPPAVEVVSPETAGKALYFIASGHVRMRVGPLEEMLHTGDVFGSASGGDGEAAAYVTAGRCRLLKLYREDFGRLEIAAPDLAARIRTAIHSHHVANIARIKARGAVAPADRTERT